MKYLNIKTASYWLASLLAYITVLTACSDDYAVVREVGTEDTSKDLLMTFQMPRVSTPTGNTTRAISEIDENYISDIDVIAFKEDGSGNWIFNYKSVGENIVDAPDANANKNKKQFGVKVIKETFPQQFVILANVRSQVNALDWNSLAGMEKGLLLEKIVFENAGQWDAASSSNFRPFPMWGETGSKTIDDATKKIEGIKMLRAISRVDIVLGTAAQANFELTGVYIYNTKTRGYVVPYPQNIDATGKATKAQVPSATATMPHNDYNASTPNDKALKYTINTPSAFERSIYLLESSAPANIDTDRDRATCLVIGGKYNGADATTWYRVDLLEDIKDGTGTVTGQKFKDFLRNHLYRFNITKVEGPGYPEPEIAFKEKTINMIAEIKEWDDGEVGDIIFDGQKYVSFHPNRDLLFGKEAGSQTVKIKTDVIEGFKITKIVGEDGVSSVDWLTIDQPLNTALGKSEAEIPMKITLTENNTNPKVDRIAYITVEAGRMHVQIKVTQTTVSIEVFEYKSMDYDKDENNNPIGQGLAIRQKGGNVFISAKANVAWRVMAQRGDADPVKVGEIDKIDGEAEVGTISVEIDPLKKLWKDDLEAIGESDKIQVWIEYDLGGQTATGQIFNFYQVPYQLEFSSTISTSINKYGEFDQLTLKGYFPELKLRAVDQDGNVASDVVVAEATGDIINKDNFSTTVKYLVYANYTGAARSLKLQYFRPHLASDGTTLTPSWDDLGSLIPQQWNGLTLPTSGYKATRGVLGIGKRTGKLRLDGSQNFYGGTADEDVYMVCFMWGSLFALKAERLSLSKDRVDISSVGDMGTPDGKIQSLNDFIAWLPPGFSGDINNLPLHDMITALILQGDEDLASMIHQHHYLRIPACWDDYLPTYNDLVTGLGDPCRAAQNEGDNNYGDYRMPWGTGDANHEATTLTFGRGNEPISLGLDDFYYVKNEYYKEENRQYIPAYALAYSVQEVMQDENGDDLEQPYMRFSYMGDYPERSKRREFYSYWTSVRNNTNDLNEAAYILWGGTVPDGYHSLQTQNYIYRNVAMPVRCVK